MKTKTISVTSGKGGVGKTTLAANLALSLAGERQRVLVFDGDFGMANADILFGVRPEGHLMDVLAGRRSMAEILIEVAPGVHLLPGGSGLTEFSQMNNFQRRSLLDAVAALHHDFSWMVVDTPSGLSDNVLYLNSAADATVVVLTPDPASFADSYALIKVMNQRLRSKRFSVVCNMVRDDADGLGLFKRFAEATNRFLDVGLDYGGSVPLDAALRRSNQMQRLVLRHEPASPAAVSIRRLASRMSRETSPSEVRGGMQIFWQQVVGTA